MPFNGVRGRLAVRVSKTKRLVRRRLPLGKYFVTMFYSSALIHACCDSCWKAWFLRKSNLTNNFKGQSLHSISRAPLGRYTSSEKEAPLSSASNTSFTLTTIPCLPQDEEMGFSSPPMIAEGDHACSLEPLSPSPSLDMDHRNVRPRTDDFTDIVLDISAANTQVR